MLNHIRWAVEYTPLHGPFAGIPAITALSEDELGARLYCRERAEAEDVFKDVKLIKFVGEEVPNT